MAGECGAILKVVEPIKSFVFDAVREYVGYIGSCEENLGALHKSLSNVCNKKDDIKKKVKAGNDKLEEITREAASWLQDVRILTEDEELKGLMYKDMETAKLVVKLMGKKDLKRRVSKESEMQEVVIKVMKKLEEELENSEDEVMWKIREADYKQVAEVVVEVMKDTIDEFKKLMKEDKKMAVVAMRTLKGRDLDKLTKGDAEMEEIVREAGNVSDEEQWPNQEDEESNALRPLLVKIPDVGSGKNTVKEAAKKLFTPLANLLTPLGKLMGDANFKKVMPEAEGVKLGLEVIDGLLFKGRRFKKDINDDTKQHRGCCCSSLLLCHDYHGRYQISKAAENMAKHIKEDFISKCPQDPVTLPKRTVDLMLVPTQFLKNLESRTQLLRQILEKLNDDQVDAVGLFGMGGTGKTTLAKEVNERVKDIFSMKVVMVEVSDAPDIVRIQGAIAESIDLPLHDVDNVAQRAIRLYNRLTSEQGKKILIILDNIWKKLNLDDIGIPRTCKLLLTTRDKEVCRVMDVKDVNVVEVGVMNPIEARVLFKSQAGNQIDDREYRIVAERLLNKCGGLPLAIVATANSLKDKDLSSWEKFARDMENPISSQVTGDYRRTYSILNSSYKFIEVDQKRIFFLLACLCPIGSSASIESLTRYGIGLDLFQHVNKLCEAMELSCIWANELVQSSMLLEGDVTGDVKIHDIVRAFAISFATKEGHKFMVEGIPRWLNDETLKEYTAMSFTSRNDYSRLSGLEAYKLQILILKGDLSENLTEIFFQGMVNLEVLAMSNMNFLPCLPKSMRKLRKLRTLCMEGCKLGDIKQVGELVNLLVLSLHESVLEEIPNEIGELCKLRLLDLSGCTRTCSKVPLIPTVVLGKLSRLEGLYMFNERQSVFGTKVDDEKTIAMENSTLPCLNAFEVKVAETEGLPIGGQSLENVDKFRVCVGGCKINYKALQPFCRVLYFDKVEYLSRFLEKSPLNVLVKKVDFLNMYGCNNFEHLSPQLDKEGFKDLRSLTLCLCNDIKYIVDGCAMNNIKAFPCLRLLDVSKMWNLKKVCNGEAPPGTFSSLQTLKLHELNELPYVLPLVPRNLKEIDVSDCLLLKFMFIEDETHVIEDEETHVIELPFLKKLKLKDLPRLLSLVGPKSFSNTSDALQGRQVFFDGKIVLPSLELFELICCDDVVELWSKEIYASRFQNLKYLKIEICDKLMSVGSPSIFSMLVQLETLTIKYCKMREIITFEETEIGEQIIRFPQLKYLEIYSMCNLESFYGGGSKLEFPKLKMLKLGFLECMNRFAKLENSSSLFHEKIDFPCLEELEVQSMNDKVEGLWDMQALSATSNPAPMLRQLSLGKTAGLRQIPKIILENLSSLKVEYFDDDDVLFASSNLGEKKGFVWTYSQLPKLKELKVQNTDSLKELFGKEDCNGTDDALTSFCARVKTLELHGLGNLNLIPLQLFKGLASLTLYRLKWEYVISVDALGDSLQQLQFLVIDHCRYMEALVNNVGLRFEFPCLRRLCLQNLNSFRSFSSTLKREATLLLPSLESLEIKDCDQLEYFWSGSIVAPRLQDVGLFRCDKLKQFLIGNSEDMTDLPSLQMVCIEMCDDMQSISSGPLIAPKLRKVKLQGCDRMQCFLPGIPNHNGDLQFPFLETVDISNSPNLHSFSLTRPVAPKLTQIQYEGKEHSMLLYNDLNHFLKQNNVK